VSEFTAVDLFAGAGGFSEGFRRAGFDVVAYVESDMYASETLRTRHQFWQLSGGEGTRRYWDYLEGKIAKDEFRKVIEGNDPVINITLKEDTLPFVTEKIKEILLNSRRNKVDVLIGGPPCQAYSHIGRARDRGRMLNDPRRFLYKYYVHFLNALNPSVFVFENVPGLLTVDGGSFFGKLIDEFRHAGYSVDFRPHVLDSFDFGVLQHRKRVVIIGWHESKSLSYPEFQKVHSNYRVIELLSDLPPIEPGRSLSEDYFGPPTGYLKDTKIRILSDRLTQHDTRPLREVDREIYRYVINIWDTEKRRVRYSELPEHLKSHKNTESFQDRFKVIASDLEYAQSVVAHLAKDGHYFIHPCVKQARSISVREAARLQSFPDNYYFEGGGLQRYRQIGNAVPPLMAEKIARKIKELLVSYESSGSSSSMVCKK